MIAPAGTSRDGVQRMSDEVNRSEETQTKRGAMGTFAEGTSPQACDAFIAPETAKWATVTKNAGVTAD